MLIVHYYWFINVLFYFCYRALLQNSNGSVPILLPTAPNGQITETNRNREENTIRKNNKSEQKSLRGNPLRQVIAAFIANIGTINTGLVFGFSAVVTPQLKQPDSIIPIDESQESWIGKFSNRAVCFFFSI